MNNKILMTDPTIIPKPSDRNAQILIKRKEDGLFVLITPRGMPASEKLCKEMMEGILWWAWCDDIEYAFLDKEMELDRTEK